MKQAGLDPRSKRCLQQELEQGRGVEDDHADSRSSPMGLEPVSSAPCASDREHVVEYRIAAVYEVLGERDEALRWLEKDIADRDGLGSWLVWLNYDPVWDAARKDPRFREIQRRVGW